ncbi:MAG TPA: hypothetical protein DHC76_21110 [Rhodobacteraceae bacterium]|nr:hypothetical protein [Paracoccaceae bacterium]
MLSKILKSLDNIRFGKTDFQMQMKARAFNRRVGTPVPSETPLVIFAMPLVSRRRSEDWDRVQANLATTLASFMTQSDPNWTVYICGRDRPALPDDDRVHFIETNISDKFYDKGDKRRALISHIAGDLKRDGYYMQFDADDILHPKFVEHVLADNNGRGYLIDTGYFIALAEQRVVALDNFNAFCGSCAAVYVDFRTHKTYTKFLSQHRSHTQIAAYCTLYERPLSAVPFKAALYLTGHGENMYGRRGLLSDRTKTLVEVALSEDDAKATLKEFSVSWADLV